jgi:hypothetical protein
LARPGLDVVDALQVFVAAVDPGQAPARDAIDLVRVLDRVCRVAEAAKVAAAGRVAESSLWSRAGHRSAAHWMARETGIGVGEAVKLLETADAVAAAPVVQDALARGVVSPRQARAAVRAESAQPGAGARLVEKAPQVSVTELEADAGRVVAGASTETPEARAERHRKSRRIYHGVNADGMGYGGWLAPIAEHTRFVAQLEAEQAKVFAEAKARGERESAEAYAADAFFRIADRGAGKASVADGEAGSSGAVGEDWSFVKTIVRVDLGALDRGAVAPGEVCEIAGRGPVPVADVWRMIDGDAFVAAVTTYGTEIDKVVHLGRRPTVLQRTALEWFSAGECSIEGCTSPARIEIDHVADWADTHITTLSELASPCGHHHDLKTHHGHTFGPRLPSGKRQLIPPDDPDPPGPGPSSRVQADGDGEQRGLFDSG